MEQLRIYRDDRTMMPPFVDGAKAPSLDLLKPSLGKGELASDAQSLFDQRQIARNNADFTESDRLRGLLLEVGVVVRDSKDGQSWEWLI